VTCIASISPAGWHRLSDDQQLAIARAALQFALYSIADQADLLAGEIDQGTLADRGGPDALRLLASILRITSSETADTKNPVQSPTPDLAYLHPAGTA
jgi:hypothetical protein